MMERLSMRSAEPAERRRGAQGRIWEGIIVWNVTSWPKRPSISVQVCGRNNLCVGEVMSEVCTPVQVNDREVDVQVQSQC